MRSPRSSASATEVTIPEPTPMSVHRTRREPIEHRNLRNLRQTTFFWTRNFGSIPRVRNPVSRNRNRRPSSPRTPKSTLRSDPMAFYCWRKNTEKKTNLLKLFGFSYPIPNCFMFLKIYVLAWQNLRLSEYLTLSLFVYINLLVNISNIFAKPTCSKLICLN